MALGCVGARTTILYVIRLTRNPFSC